MDTNNGTGRGRGWARSAQTRGGKRKRTRMGDRLRRAGFDLTSYHRDTGYYRPKCSQCEALVINGVACHERGCPNKRTVRNA